MIDFRRDRIEDKHRSGRRASIDRIDQDQRVVTVHQFLHELDPGNPGFVKVNVLGNSAIVR